MFASIITCIYLPQQFINCPFLEGYLTPPKFVTDLFSGTFVISIVYNLQNISLWQTRELRLISGRKYGQTYIPIRVNP